MISDEIRQKLQNIVRGACQEGSADACSTIRDHLIEGFGANPTIKSEFEGRSIVKKKQAAFLKSYAENSDLWLISLPADAEYLTRGGESKIYLAPDKLDFIKVNDSIYYATWLEYFTSLVIHNTLFPQTSYSLVGFTQDSDSLCAVLKQPFVEGVQIDGSEERSILWLVWWGDFVQDMKNSGRGYRGMERRSLENIRDKAVFDFYAIFFVARQIGA